MATAIGNDAAAGIDVESTDLVAGTLAVADRWLAPSDQAQIHGGPQALRVRPGVDEGVDEWRFWTTGPTPRHRLAVCWQATLTPDAPKLA
mgnify:CR=1 FL=1